MIKTPRYLVLTSAVGLLMTASVSQASTISLVGVGDSPSQSYSDLKTGQTAPSVTGSFGFGGGILFDISLSQEVAFEFGGLYLTRKIETNGTNATPITDDVTSTYHEIQVPFLLRFRLFPMVHVGFGGYWATAMGDIDSEDATTSSSSNSSLTYSAANLKSSDYGLMGTAGFSFPIRTSGTHLMLDARYAYGLENISTSSSATLKNRDVEILAGFSFPIGSRNGR